MTTPLILAVEPDRQQAAQLTSIARGLSVELVLAESLARALAALSERLPDLILTPPLLSRRDDLALTERLRELGEAGAHIQTLTTPTLEMSEPPSRGGSMLSALRREKTRAAGPTGCDAVTFAEQIAVYLERATAACRARAEPPPPEPVAPPADKTAALVCVELVDVLPIPPIAMTDATEGNTAECHQADPLDEWSVFDPCQPRFAALLAKLDEIAREEGGTSQTRVHLSE